MISVITDILQSLSICILAITVIFLSSRVRRHDTRLDSQKIAKELREAYALQYPEPICGCTHHQCFHDENGCGEIRTYFHYGHNTMIPDNKTDVQCGCKRYTGPEPLPQVIP